MDQSSSLEKTTLIIHLPINSSPLQLAMLLILWLINIQRKGRIWIRKEAIGHKWKWLWKITKKQRLKLRLCFGISTMTIYKYIGWTTMFRWRKEQARSTDGRRCFEQTKSGQQNGLKSIKNDSQLPPLFGYYFIKLNYYQLYTKFNTQHYL